MSSSEIFMYAMLGIVAFFYIKKMMVQRSITQYVPADIDERMKSGRSVLLDVRTAGERKSSSIQGSFHIPLHELSSRISELKKHNSKEIICYCQSGSRSISAASTLKKAGYTVANLRGGISEWNFYKRS